MLLLHYVLQDTFSIRDELINQWNKNPDLFTAFKIELIFTKNVVFKESSFITAVSEVG